MTSFDSRSSSSSGVSSISVLQEWTLLPATERVQLMASSAENFIRHFNIGRSFDMSGAVPRLLEIPGQIQSFLVDGLGLADPGCASLQEAVVSTRRRAAERIGCDASWDAILDRTAEVAEISRAWREGTGAGRPG